MPGILPMKVIKVGTSSQSRIAQACDRCRSKKIRCDGTRPTCSQCANVGFECKTSDKLSRRAFPRGYTESLEERVRQLELEVRELKDLLDEKDEKIDLLSKLHSHQRPAMSPVPPAETRGHSSPAVKEDVFRVQASPLLLGFENSDSYFMGPSSGRAFIETFKRRIQESGKPCGDFALDAFLHIQGCTPLIGSSPSQASGVPPRLFTDRCVNVFFQEWAPLFPVLHKPTFLQLYEDFSTDVEKIKSNQEVAHLYLVFSIAGLSSQHPDNDQIAACESQWTKALEGIMMDNTMGTLRCLLLAMIYCMMRADYKRLQYYKAVAVGLSHRLGLHQSAKRCTFGALTIESRKKVFWTLYSLDCFSAAMLGLPKLLKEEDIHAEYPADTDDEYVTENGFQPTLPGEYTRISSALALFRLSRILARALEQNYPATNSYDLSLQQMAALDAELQEWSGGLPNHLKLNFVQDKPSTDVTGSRSPILALAYYYVRTLVHRPAIGSTLGTKAAPALLATADSSKHIVQIIGLLEERSMSFSFCLNKTDILVVCAMTLLYQSLDLKQESKLMKDAERLINSVLKSLQKARASGTVELKRVAKMLIQVEDAPQPTTKARSNSSSTRAAPLSKPSPLSSMLRKTSPYSLGRQHGAIMSETDLLSQQEKLRRLTMPNSTRKLDFYQPQRSSFDSETEQPTPHRDSRFSISQIQRTMMRMSPTYRAKQNMDYQSFNNTNTHMQSPSPVQHHYPVSQPMMSPQEPHVPTYPLDSMSKVPSASSVSLHEWEAMVGAMDGGQLSLYDAIYGGPAVSLETPTSTKTNYNEWPPDSWDLSTFNIGDFATNPDGPQSVLSLSDESLSSGDEHASGDFFLSMSGDEYTASLRQQIPPARNSHDGSLEFLDGLRL